MRAATLHAVDERNYKPRERELAEHAMDAAGNTADALSFAQATAFPGFPSLSLLAQLPEYRAMHERLADECIRMWGKVASSGDADPAVLAEIEAELKRIDLSSVIRQVVIHDQSFGGAHVLFKLKDDESFRDTPLVLRRNTVRKGAFEGLRIVEPYWVSPNAYNSIDPSAADFYKPSSWFMIGTQVHATRLRTIISRPVPDMLKPSYSFRGVSMTQLAMPYVDNWLRTRQSVSDTVKQFSVSGVKTDLQQALLPGAQSDLTNRANLINAYRDNRNLLLLDMATEEFFQVNTPLAGLSDLQAQAQEQMSAVCHIPLVVLLGITPTGLNASSEGEIRVFYDYVKGYQKNVLLSLMTDVLRIVQLSLFGEVDDHITWEWTPLLEMTPKEEGEIHKANADTDAIYIENGVISAQQVAERLNADPKSPYAGLLAGEDGQIEPADGDIPAITDQILALGQEGGVPPAVPAEPAPADTPAPEDHALDAHWVTAKPNGPDNKGTPLLIGSGGKVVGGAGGKLDGKKKGGDGGGESDEPAKNKTAERINGAAKRINQLNALIKSLSKAAWSAVSKQTEEVDK
ncbi:portal protein [Ralstonia phage PQ43W]